MNGTTNVTTTNSFFRINQMSTTNGVNAGNITAKISTVTYAKINAGIGQTQMSIYTVPAGYTFYLDAIQANANVLFTASNYLTFAEYNKYNSTGEINLLEQSTFVQYMTQTYKNPIPHPEKTDIQYQVKAFASTNIASLLATGILIKNPD